MEYDLFNAFAGAIGAIGAAIGAVKLINELAIGKRGQMRDEYKFAKDFLQDVESNEQLHPFLREKGYQAIAGYRRINADEIKYLLSLEGSEQALRDYTFGRSYLEYLPGAGFPQITYQKKYEATRYRLWWKNFYFSVYGVMALLAFTPLLLSGFIFFKTPGQILAGLVISTLAFGPCAYFALREGVRIQQAEKLVEQQHKAHTENRAQHSTISDSSEPPPMTAEIKH